jgi:surfeit locus 1 family protein
MRFLPLVVGVLVAAVCGRLGLWQLDRLEERRARNAVVESRLSEPPLSLGRDTLRMGLDADPGALRFRRVRAAGRFDFDRELIVIGRMDNGRPGVHVVTPLVVDDSTAVLVERGWLASHDSRSYDQAAAREPEDAVVTGVLLQAPVRPVAVDGDASWPLHVVSPDPTSVGALYPYAVLPLILRRASPPDGTDLELVALPEQDEGPHLSYALQWFGFATIAVVGSSILYARRRRAPGVANGTDSA